MSLLKVAANYLKKNTKGTILLGGKHGFEAGLSIEIIESKSDIFILDGWSFDIFGGKKNLGIGIAKDLYFLNSMEIDAGVYITKEASKIFNSSCPSEIKVGLSGSWRF